HRRPASSLKTPRRAAVGPGRGRGPGEADCLLRYAGRMPGHEVPYFEHPEKLEFPTEVWAARELRKANVLRLAIVLVEACRGLSFRARGVAPAPRPAGPHDFGAPERFVPPENPRPRPAAGRARRVPYLPPPPQPRHLAGRPAPAAGGVGVL